MVITNRTLGPSFSTDTMAREVSRFIARDATIFAPAERRSHRCDGSAAQEMYSSSLVQPQLARNFKHSIHAVFTNLVRYVMLRAKPNATAKYVRSR